MTHLANDVIRLLDAPAVVLTPEPVAARAEDRRQAPAAVPTPEPIAAQLEDRRQRPRRPFVRQIACFSLEDPPIIALRTRDLSPDGHIRAHSPQPHHA
jgi:hypothetical protein